MSLIATCHCGATKIALAHLPSRASTCNCSFCARTGAVWGTYAPGTIEVLSNAGQSTYSASQGLNLHHFCSTCGLHTWGDSPDWGSIYNDDGTPKDANVTAIPTARSYSVNLRLIEDLDWSKLDIINVDGRNDW